jgi:hypothetical protein
MMSKEVLDEKRLLTLVMTSPLGGRIPILVDDILEATRIADGVKIRWHPIVRCGTIDIACYLIELEKGLALSSVVGVLSAYIYDRLKGKADVKLEVEDLDVPLDDEGHLRRMLIKELEEQQRSSRKKLRKASKLLFCCLTGVRYLPS